MVSTHRFGGRMDRQPNRAGSWRRAGSEPHRGYRGRTAGRLDSRNDGLGSSEHLRNAHYVGRGCGGAAANRGADNTQKAVRGNNLLIF